MNMKIGFEWPYGVVDSTAGRVRELRAIKGWAAAIWIVLYTVPTETASWLATVTSQLVMHQMAAWGRCKDLFFMGTFYIDIWCYT